MVIWWSSTVLLCNFTSTFSNLPIFRTEFCFLCRFEKSEFHCILWNSRDGLAVLALFLFLYQLTSWSKLQAAFPSFDLSLFCFSLGKNRISKQAVVRTAVTQRTTWSKDCFLNEGVHGKKSLKWRLIDY